VWEPESWTELEDAPDLAEIYACQHGGDVGAHRSVLAETYDAHLATDRASRT
jgi:hypothetical protein